MADENENTPDLSEFDAPASTATANKDLWLFLIVVDVICLCIFGFFLYKNLSAKLLLPPAEVPPVAAETALLVEDEVVVSQPALAEPVKQAPAELVAPAPEAAEVPAATPQPVENVSALPVEMVEEVQPEKTIASTEKKESVTVVANPKSKYRQVTFRYFEPAQTAAVVSGFTMAKPRAMTKKNGVWEVTLSIAPGTYKYLLVVDGVQQTDPYAPEQDGRSILVVK